MLALSFHLFCMFSSLPFHLLCLVDQGELAAVQQECAQQQQQANALRAAMVASDHAAAQLRQELAELMQTKQVSSREEDSVKEKLKEAEKAADEQCVALAALVDQLVQENLDLGARLNAKSAALTKARHEVSQMQVRCMNYGRIECFKNGRIFSSKYESVMKHAGAI
ncbi:hypothetical protein DUNSADRAFT_4030 [Dunaliella salina]|uniref:Uncharacterized protein n=1 Tax=Dunaliella salina TaxID=3046 RepID=A0ABQ7FV11_DUNSA|nr:hypothetical protein DUNSADRAFT_4030 [Dunaliella salina]|eukprot:KAF5826231.1 hypothetical protein DUNSADRAFT_4030 [Dunaliella salina]